MKKHFQIFNLLLAFSTICLAQKSIDLSLTYPQGSGISRNFSIYEPVGFDKSTSNKLIIGFHPFNVGVWNANSWRDTLRSFIDLTGALYVCPDGGVDGKVDDSVDLEFTEVLIDSISSWYQIDQSKIFLIGFSVGGKAVYDYAFSHPKQIKGSIPIGAAVETTSYTGRFINGRCEAFYLVHGNNDNPNSRYYPMKTGLELKDALVDGILMGNVGHTINFPQRDAILNKAFNFVDTSDCDFTGVHHIEQKEEFQIFPSLVKRGETFQIRVTNRAKFEIFIFNSVGQILAEYKGNTGSPIVVNSDNLPLGMNFIRLKSEGKSEVKRIILLE